MSEEEVKEEPNKTENDSKPEKRTKRERIIGIDLGTSNSA